MSVDLSETPPDFMPADMIGVWLGSHIFHSGYFCLLGRL